MLGRYNYTHTRRTYQEDNRDVEQERDTCVGEQGNQTNAVNVGHGQPRELSDEEDASVDGSTGRGVVVEGHEGVHLEVGAAEQALDHDQTDGLEDDTGDLEQEADHDELDLTEGRNHDTDDDEGHISERLEVNWLHAKAPGCEEDGDGCSSLSGVSFVTPCHDRCHIP